MRVSARSHTVVGLCVALLALGACTDGDPEEPGASSSPPTASADPTPTGSPSASPGEATSSAAATGPALTVDVARLHLPAGWTKLEQLVSSVDTGDGPAASSISLTSIEAFGVTRPDELAEFSLTNGGYAGLLKREPDIELAGLPAYRLVGKDNRGDFRHSTHEEVGATYGDKTVTVVIDLSRSLSAAERQQIRDMVLASFEWK